MHVLPLLTVGIWRIRVASASSYLPPGADPQTSRGAGRGAGRDWLDNEVSKAPIQSSSHSHPHPTLQEIRGLLAHAGVQEVMACIEGLEEPSLQDLICITEIPAPHFMEEERAGAYAEILREAGADSVCIDGIGNIIALRRGTTGDRTVALDGHLDTDLPPESDITVQFRGDTLYAPCIGNDTRGLIVVHNVLEAMVAADFCTEDDLLFIGTVGEEGLGDLRGVKYLFGEEGPGIDVFIAVDGRDETRIVHQAVGSHRYRVTFHGPGGHSWGAFGLANPHHAMALAIAHFVPEADAFICSGPRTSYSIARIGGGSVNSIHFESWFEVDMAVIILQDREPALGGGSTNANTPIAEGIPSITIGRGETEEAPTVSMSGGFQWIPSWRSRTRSSSPWPRRAWPRRGVDR